MGRKPSEPLIVDGKRKDGRSFEELRKIEVELGVVTRANGSALVKFGDTVALAAVYGPAELHPAHLREYQTGILRCRYSLAPFSVEERKVPGFDRRSVELSKVIRVAIEPAIFLEEFPKAVVDVFVEILQADGSTRVTAINATNLALISAGIPMRDFVVACSVGKIDNCLVVDLNGIEDNFSQADINFAFMPNRNKITLFQGDGQLTKNEIKELISLAKKSCEKIYEVEKGVLSGKYSRQIS
ncbi:MAG: exosome complex exonuclease Rrp41 [Candidatus Aenigmarchaeota archaeon]|nr:exosome complex exonuclease Rrp41 [Candidatus Aenigmarchaeota archaeon]